LIIGPVVQTFQFIFGQEALVFAFPRLPRTCARLKQALATDTENRGTGKTAIDQEENAQLFSRTQLRLTNSLTYP
jgi:hypothetical protein